MNFDNIKVFCDVMACRLINSSKLLNDRSALIVRFGDVRTSIFEFD